LYQMQRRKIVAKDTKMIAIVLLLPFFFWFNVAALVTVAIA
jgi:tryptophan-rich sensory protein